MQINLDVQTLRSFLKISQLGGFSRAADALRLTQPAISQQIKRLEELLGAELFSRDGRIVRLTPAGEKLRVLAERFLETNDEIVEVIGRKAKKEVVHLGMPEHFSETLLPGIIGNMRDFFPHVQLVIKIGRSPVLSEAIDQGRIDLGLLIDQSGTQNGFRSEAIPVRWFASNIVRSRFNEAEEIPLVLFQAPCAFRRSAIQALEESGLRWRCAYEAEDLASLKAAVVANMGTTVLPLTQPFPEMRGVAELNNMPKLPPFEVSLKSRNGWKPPYFEAMTDSIASAFGSDLGRVDGIPALMS